MSEEAAGSPPRAFFEFRLVRRLGRGAMGEVFLAEDELLGREVAIKFVRDADRPEVRARFLLEARALARLSHPNVVTVHRVGEVLGRPFLVSELVKGDSLDRVPLPVPAGAALQIALQLARALAAVHRVGVLHRDVKPANVLLAVSGEVKLVDFGVQTELSGSAGEALLGPVGGVHEAAGPVASEAGPISLAETQELPGAPPRPIPTGETAFREHATGPQPPSRPSPSGLRAGTPLYAAPELLAGGPGSRQSDLYGWGAVVYEVCSGRPPYAATSLDELGGLASAGRFAPLTNVHPALAALVHRCLQPLPQARPARAEEVLEILEPLLLEGEGRRAPDQPYRGLSVFGPEHAALFFGREREVAAVLDRLRAASFVVVAGDSGVGKSSLCRAGVLPQIEAGALGRGRRYQSVEVELGRRPALALAAALAPWLGVDEQAAARSLREDPEQVAARLRAVPAGEGRALFLDGLEELVLAGSGGDDAEAVSRFLGALALKSAGLRCLSTVRSEALTRLSALPSLGAEVNNGLYLLRPLTDEGLRQAIEGPARAAGFRFVPESLVDEMVAAARLGPGALPLVQFALAELWQRRDVGKRQIGGEALAAIGGVGGALARHADAVVAGLPGPQRRAAEELLRRLVTPQGTRTRRTRRELPEGDDTTRALSALTQARLISSRDPVEGDGEPAYELAHEALLQAWDQLRAWVGKDVEKRALAQRIERAAEEWERLGRTSDALWSRRRLRELSRSGALPLGDREQRFVAASKAGARLRRLWQAALLVGAPALIALVVAFVRVRAGAAAREEAAVHRRAAQAAIERAKTLDAQEAALRLETWAAFDAGDAAQGELRWGRVRALRARSDEQLTAARAELDGALLLAPDDETRKLLPALLLLRLGREGGDPLSKERAGLLAQLAPFDPRGLLRAPFERPARLRLTTTPPGAQATLRPLLDASLPAVAITSGAEVDVKAGSYVLELPLGARLPLLLRFGERRELTVALGPAPQGFIRVPAGRYLTGFDGDEDVRLGFFAAPPLHERDGGAFAIARTEVTFGQWLEYLRALPPTERAARTPRAVSYRNGLALLQRADGRFVLRIKPTTVEYQAPEGEPIVYPGRVRNASQDWRSFPVSGVSFEDGRAYAAWLGSTGKVPGARLCREDEWERAARGADGRSFPGGDTLAGDDANLDETYGRQPLAFGPDAAGSHPRSDSPVGAADLAGNAWELTMSRTGTPVIRGGSWYQGALTARSVNREPYEPTARDLLIGLRLCADLR